MRSVHLSRMTIARCSAKGARNSASGRLDFQARYGHPTGSIRNVRYRLGHATVRRVLTTSESWGPSFLNSSTFLPLQREIPCDRGDGFGPSRHHRGQIQDLAILIVQQPSWLWSPLTVRVGFYAVVVHEQLIHRR
jgi:hypothetical protein